MNPKLSVAPMMDYTDRHYRYLARLVSPNSVLYTEMVTAQALIHGDAKRFLAFDKSEHPVVLQVGGSELDQLAYSARLAQLEGYDEINLNVGCPSERVQSGAIGACLMAQPEVVAQCVQAMQEAADIPVTVKTRTGIDDQDSYSFLYDFVSQVASVGCKTFIIHARKAWLSGLSPKENRSIPELKYDVVYRLKQDFPHLNIIINGGITTVEAVEEHLNYVDGVMIGRQAYHDLYFMAELDHHLYGSELASRAQILKQYYGYIENQMAQGVPLNRLLRPVLGLFHGIPGGKNIRRVLTEQGQKQQSHQWLLDVVQALS